jgi:hypothetical protein
MSSPTTPIRQALLWTTPQAQIRVCPTLFDYFYLPHMPYFLLEGSEVLGQPF